MITKNCPIHGRYEVKYFKLGKNEIEIACPGCMKDQDIIEKKELLIEFQNSEKKSFKLKMDKAGIPERFRECTLDNYITKNEGQKKALFESRKYIKNFDDIKKSGAAMFYCGSFGTGKTHLSIAIMMDLMINKKINGIYSTTMRMFRDIRSSYNNNNISEQSIIDKYINIDLLILDEVGVQMGTDSEKILIYEIINGRYEKYKPTIILSNLSFEGITKYLGVRSIDRLKNKHGSMVVMDWKSYRNQRG